MLLEVTLNKFAGKICIFSCFLEYMFDFLSVISEGTGTLKFKRLLLYP